MREEGRGKREDAARRVTALRSKCATLSLVLKREWYDMICRGEKREEYRAATDYWHKRLERWDKSLSALPVVEFRLGYAKDAPRAAFWVFGLNTFSGMKTYALIERYTDKPRHPEWGEPNEPHFVIKLGGRVNLIADC
jgi:hypothetical protein